LVKRLQLIYQRAATSVGVTEGVQSIQFAIQMHLTRLQTADQQLVDLIDALSSILAALPEAKYLLSVQALGTVSVAMILAEIGDPKRYQNGSQWSKLAGVQPTPYTSGKKQRSLTPMSKQGRPRLRSVLYFACLRMIQIDDHFKKIYLDLQRRKSNPLTKMQAVGVLMNKLLHILWALINKQTCYNPSFAQSI
jgi:transposase